MTTYSLAGNIPESAISLARISDADIDPATGLPTMEGVDDQARNQADWARLHGWTIGKTIKTPKLTAYKRRKTVMPDGTEVWRVWRPDLQEALRLLWTGVHDGLIVTDLDRYGRDPYDLEDLIALVERKRGKIRIGSITGSLDLDTDAGMANARIMMAIARKSSQDTARRVSSARTRQALAGKYGGGRRPFGFGVPRVSADGVTSVDCCAVRPDEAEEIVKAADAILGGVSLRGVVQDLRERGVPTVTGRPWNTATVKDLLVRPRTAGLMVNQGQVVGTAPWDPIIPEETWKALVAKLTHPDRTNTPGPAAKWFGSGIYRCGCPGCGNPLYVIRPKSGAGLPRYRCGAGNNRPSGTTGHVARQVQRTDEHVVRVLLDRLARPDAAELLVSPDAGVDVAALQARAAVLRANKSDLVAARAADAIDQVDMLRGVRIIREELGQIQTALSSGAEDHLLRPLIEADDIEAAWDGMTLGTRREVLRKILTVTILPAVKAAPFADGIRIDAA